MKDQRKNLLVNQPKVVFATLGRLLEVFDKEYISFMKMKLMIVDEADKFRMYPNESSASKSNHSNKISSWSDLKQVFHHLPMSSCRIAAFSATYTKNTLFTLQK